MNSAIRYAQSVKTELANVEWPKRKEVIRLTLIVVAISAIVGSFTGLLDFVFTNLFSSILSL